ncbi:HEAT repeat domain-containing protein, partial [Halopiger djelfimassiliensis]|uniref:HEAT repeat domain-containing protein n=1 Tax=Halopiger djelfimassiliensis TaxID=1293047 RepID=UPI000677FEF4
IRDHISEQPPEKAADLYYGLIARGDDAYANRAFPVIAHHPDEKALHALLLCLWYDDPDLVPQALEVLRSLLETKPAFTENDQGFDQRKVLREIGNRIDSSEHPEIRIAAIETLADLEPADPSLVDRDHLIETIESALDDPDEDVRQAAGDALDRLE